MPTHILEAPIFQVKLNSVNTLMYTGPPGVKVTIICLMIVNIDTLDRTFRIYDVPAGDTPDDTNPIFYDEPATAKRMRQTGGQIIGPGREWWGIGSADDVIIVTAYGVRTSEAT